MITSGGPCIRPDAFCRCVFIGPGFRKLQEFIWAFRFPDFRLPEGLGQEPDPLPEGIDLRVILVLAQELLTCYFHSVGHRWESSSLPSVQVSSSPDGRTGGARYHEGLSAVSTATGFTPRPGTLISRASIIRAYSRRWAIETFYRDGMQNPGLEASVLRTSEGAKRDLCLGLVAFTLLQLGTQHPRLGGLIRDNFASVGKMCQRTVTEAVRPFLVEAMKWMERGVDVTITASLAFMSRRQLKWALAPR
jgi:hypothetical protein